MLNKEFGGAVERKEGREDGQFTITVDVTSPLFRYTWMTFSFIGSFICFYLHLFNFQQSRHKTRCSPYSRWFGFQGRGQFQSCWNFSERYSRYVTLHWFAWFYLTLESFLAISNEAKKLYGVQFHPEVDLSTNGKQMMKNFLFNVAGLTGNFTMKSREGECIDYIRKTVGSNKVLVSVPV